MQSSWKFSFTECWGMSALLTILLPRALRFWVGTFHPQAFFALHSFTDILPAFIRTSLGAGSFSLGFPGLHTDPQDSPSVCLIHSNPQSLYSERFFFNFYHIFAWIACAESLIYLLLTRFKLFSLVQSYM